MSDGLVALSKFQAGLESVRGTAVAATRIQPANSGFMNPVQNRNQVHEQRNTFVDIFRSFPVKQMVELRGMTVSPTYEDLPWYLQSMVKGGVSGVLSAVTAYTYTFAPTPGTDDLKTVTWEVGNDTQAWQCPFGVGERLDLQFTAGAAATQTMDYLAQRPVKQAFTGSLSDRVTEDINGAQMKAYIDSTTIGSTAVTNVLSAKFGLQNNWTQLWALDGNLYPRNAYRKVRSATLELTIQMTNTTEYDAYITTPVQRKIRLQVQGTNIAGSTGPVAKSMTIDFYTYWDVSPISDQGGIYVLKLTGTSTYDATATNDFSITVVNALPSLP
jgi:hypothetical protein